MTQAVPYQSFPNSFKRDLLAGKKLIGCWSSLASPITAEVLGLAVIGLASDDQQPMSFLPASKSRLKLLGND